MYMYTYIAGHCCVPSWASRPDPPHRPFHLRSMVFWSPFAASTCVSAIYSSSLLCSTQNTMPRRVHECHDDHTRTRSQAHRRTQTNRSRVSLQLVSKFPGF